MKNQRILLLTPALPYPPTQGASLRNYHILRGLAEKNKVSLLSFAAAKPTTEDQGQLDSLCENFTFVPLPHRSTSRRLRDMLLSPFPDMGHRLHTPSYFDRLEEMLRHPFDIVQIEGIELARSLPLIRQHQPQAKIIFDNHNAETDLQWRTFLTDLKVPRRWPAAAYSLIQVAKLRRFERWICHQADGVVAVSQADADTISRLAPHVKRPVKVIPNTIDINQYRVQPEPSDPQYDLLFTGKMDYRPNVDGIVWFLREIWPLIEQKRPQTSLAIVGQQPHPLVQSAARQAGSNVTLTGFVPEIPPYLAGARVVILPLRMGSGTRLKLLEALASQKAVVATRAGAEGFNFSDSSHLILADRPPEFASEILRLLDDEAARQGLSASGREFAARYDWRVVVPEFLSFYAQLSDAI
ncbi:MAG: glycosyltransferase [Ardenticatenaceae bacterium]|nr:glycosyltransferase [Ardenticatenaceae bacterium]